MWRIEPTTGWEKDQKHYAKKHPNELAAVIANLERFFKLLNVSRNSKCVQAGYLHTESMGILAVDQKGHGSNLQETRLYFYADDPSKIVHLIAIGDKSTQHSDVEYCKSFVRLIRGEKE